MADPVVKKDEEVVNQVADDGHLEMSDEEFLNAPAPTLTPVVEKPVADGEGDPPADGGDATGDKADPDADGAEQVEVPGKDAVENGSEAADKAAKEPVEDDKTKEQVVDKTKAAEKPADGEIDYKAAYERVIAPFKANGREIKVDSVDDAIALMQMGANYNKKMASLKPNLKLMKLLENNGLLNEEKIGFLIDLDRKNPEAISKLIKDGNLEPMELDADKASGYKQTAYTVDDREIDLDNVLEDLKDSPAYTRTLDIVSTKWDAASKQFIASKPDVLRLLNDHVEHGIYDVISSGVEKERMLGRLKGMTDLEAYKHVGDAIESRGGFNHLRKGSSQTQEKPTVAKEVVAPADKAGDDKLKDKRRAASSTKANSTAAKQDFNPLEMSDEEFEKQSQRKFR